MFQNVSGIDNHHNLVVQIAVMGYMKKNTRTKHKNGWSST